MTEIVKMNNVDVVDGVLLYKNLRGDREKFTPYKKWIGRHIISWGFEEGKDFWTFLSKSTGGRRATEYYLTLDMVKHLCMLDKSDYGMKAREYYIGLEKEIVKKQTARLVGIEIRKQLVEEVDESGENIRMHGHGYSNYTKMVYKLCGINYIKQTNFRDTLSKDELDRVKTVENMVKSLLELGKEYSGIKNYLEPMLSDVMNKKLE